MEELRRLLEEVLTFDLIQATLSAPRKKEGAGKIKIRPVIIRDRLVFQASELEEKKVFHRNYEKEELIKALTGWLQERFGQLQMELSGEYITVLASRKGKITIRRKKQAPGKGQSVGIGPSGPGRGLWSPSAVILTGFPITEGKNTFWKRGGRCRS